jgi:hypothetical protein
LLIMLIGLPLFLIWFCATWLLELPGKLWDK